MNISFALLPSPISPHFLPVSSASRSHSPPPPSPLAAAFFLHNLVPPVPRSAADPDLPEQTHSSSNTPSVLMGNPGKKIDTDNLLSLGTDLVGVLGTNKDDDNLMQLKEGLRALRSSCREDSHEVHYLIEDYQKKINECKAKIEKVKGGTAEDADFEHLQREFEEELQTERLLRQELREVSDELDSLERQRVSFEERKKIVKEREKDVLRAEDLLSMCASVTNIIPNLEDETRIAGFIFDKKKKKGELFELDRTSTPIAICDKLWSIADV